MKLLLTYFCQVQMNPRVPAPKWAAETGNPTIFYDFASPILRQFIKIKDFQSQSKHSSLFQPDNTNMRSIGYIVLRQKINVNTRLSVDV